MAKIHCVFRMVEYIGWALLNLVVIIQFSQHYCFQSKKEI